MNKSLYTAFLVIISSAVAVGVYSSLTSSTTTEKEEQKYRDNIPEHYKIFAIPIPLEANFCGESVPLKKPDVRERFDRELLVNTYWQSNALLLIKRSHRWFPVIKPILKERGVPEDFAYLPLVESGFMHLVSPRGASSYWQIMEETGRENGLEINDHIDERYHIEKATHVACDYILEAKERFGNWTLAAASYNLGMSGLERQLDKQLVDNYYDLLLNVETGRYVFRILALKEIIENTDKFGFHYRIEDVYQPYDFTELKVDTTIENIAVFAQEHGANYKEVKTLNPWIRRNILPNRSRKEYTLKMPVD